MSKQTTNEKNYELEKVGKFPIKHICSLLSDIISSAEIIKTVAHDHFRNF